MKKRFQADGSKDREEILRQKRERFGLGEDRPAASSQKSKKYIAEHKVAAGETLGHISLKYYNSAVKDKWMVIYEANKEVIGENPGMLKVGQVLKIPELPS